MTVYHHHLELFFYRKISFDFMVFDICKWNIEFVYYNVKTMFCKKKASVCNILLVGSLPVCIVFHPTVFIFTNPTFTKFVISINSQTKWYGWCPPNEVQRLSTSNCVSPWH